MTVDGHQPKVTVPSEQGLKRKPDPYLSYPQL